MHVPMRTCTHAHARAAEVRTTPDAPAAAKERLKQRGPLSKGEMATLVSLGVAVAMWVMGEQLKVCITF